MGSKAKVMAHTSRALACKAPEEKLDALAHAIAELADFVDDLENQLTAIERKIR
jgi:outer membrane murein-binding lipoprotein Lpp